jgi:ElaB/YqjD/DUF883 family membrane-anchored ribosome-binding protein
MRNRLRQYDPVSIHAEAENANSAITSVAPIIEEAQKWLASAAAEIEEFVTDRPAVALTTALAAGVLLGWLIKRR